MPAGFNRLLPGQTNAVLLDLGGLFRKIFYPQPFIEQLSWRFSS